MEMLVRAKSSVKNSRSKPQPTTKMGPDAAAHTRDATKGKDGSRNSDNQLHLLTLLQPTIAGGGRISTMVGPSPLRSPPCPFIPAFFLPAHPNLHFPTFVLYLLVGLVVLMGMLDPFVTRILVRSIDLTDADDIAAAAVAARRITTLTIAATTKTKLKIKLLECCLR